MSAVLPVYKRSPLTFDYGEGVYLYTGDGEKYLDFAAGIAVNSLGHSHPHLVEALTEQAKKLWHVSNMYTIEGLEELAQRICDNCFADYAYFSNSGAEAVETAFKMIRKYHDETGNPDRFRIITFKGAFHGRTLATISAVQKPKLMAGFEPAVDGFDIVHFGDVDAVRAAITDETAAILIEPIQGEGGVISATPEFLRALRDIADENGLLLFFDEIQCGMGRTGKLFAHQWTDVEPDIVASAKGIAGGFPMGACLSTEKAGKHMTYGCHGSTYGNNPLAMSVGNAVMDIMLADGFLDNVVNISDYLHEQLNKLKERLDNAPIRIEEVRGKGLMIGLKTSCDSQELVNKLRENKLLTVFAADNVIRIVPPLIIEKPHVDEAIEKLYQTCSG